MSLERSIYSIIKSPLVTEKTTRDSVDRRYSFWVAIDANKIEIKRAIEKVYIVKVAKTSSMIVKGKMKRLRQNQAGKTVSWKKAIVALRPGFEIKVT